MALCGRCGTDIASTLLSCPACQSLVHEQQLTTLARQAEQATADARPTEALTHWRAALELLPPDSRQYQSILQKIQTLSQHVKKGSGRKAVGVGAVGAVLLSLLAKGKLLLLGLGKASTVFSMLLSLGVYWAAWGWKFAVGVVASIYIHEIGHVAALQRYGIKASAPMFIPGVGAFVQMKQSLATRHEDAVVGLAGPWWGLATAVACYGIFMLSGAKIWAAIAHTGAWLTLFNLLPTWQLDGSRGFQALARRQRWGVVAMMVVLWMVTHEGLLILLALVSGWRALERADTNDGDQHIFFQYLALLTATSLLSMMTPPAMR